MFEGIQVTELCL